MALVLAILLAGAASGAPLLAQDRAARSRADLGEVRSRLQDAQAAAQDTEKTRAEADKALKSAEQAVSRVLRKLRTLRREQQQVRKALDAVQAQQVQTRQRIDEGRAALGEWLRRYYEHGGEAGVGHLLSARDPNQLARDAYYLERIGREKQAIVGRLREAEAAFAAQASTIKERQTKLASLEREQTTQAAELKRERTRRAKILADLSATLAAQRAEIGELKKDETRLIALIKRLETAPAPRPPVPRERAAEPEGGSTGHAADASVRGRPFAQLRGALRAPVEGTFVGRFGTDRAAGGATWKGVFIRSRAGEDVRAVADGVVVYSDWLRGFGNLVIVDHGDDYLTVYGNNEALFKSTGERVLAGDIIASVGDSGGNPESGLYFEIRHKGRPVDPMDWINRD
ncbi:peptidoglycan DD-metalloendopeptidase family protein [Nitrogeniibacter mangrovi]|uniref:Peptidoglycan DD-metalloendopeptidase family protein n=1 Tax=Nitrogeniibacter mangrovi TaxID=2016596 RepID=A0A6C1B475_9RHOO|nr:peptidoglycan DD-metalloendopeptidase family protein [Nitrogeniibacter mangrovi]QID18491.1 peptidoglycan DD-metalloendopeptidase family protein [Nitrogeniibacter mangrovi]